MVYQKDLGPETAQRRSDDALRSWLGLDESALTPATRSRKLPDRADTRDPAGGAPAYDAPMSWVIRCIAAFLVAMALCTAAWAQTAAPQAAAPEVTLKSLRALLEQMPNSADSEDEVKSVNTLTNDIVAQAERFVAARTTQLVDLNARLGELGPAPAAGAAPKAPMSRGSGRPWRRSATPSTPTSGWPA